MIEYINMKFLQANTIVSDGPVVNGVDRNIIIWGNILDMSWPWKQQAANTLNHHVQSSPNANGLEASGTGKEGRWRAQLYELCGLYSFEAHVKQN